MLDDYRFDDMCEFKKVLQNLNDSYTSIYTPNASSSIQQSAARNRRNVRKFSVPCALEWGAEEKKIEFISKGEQRIWPTTVWYGYILQWTIVELERGWLLLTFWTGGRPMVQDILSLLDLQEMF